MSDDEDAWDTGFKAAILLGVKLVWFTIVVVGFGAMWVLW